MLDKCSTTGLCRQDSPPFKLFWSRLSSSCPGWLWMLTPSCLNFPSGWYYRPNYLLLGTEPWALNLLRIDSTTELHSLPTTQQIDFKWLGHISLVDTPLRPPSPQLAFLSPTPTPRLIISKFLTLLAQFSETDFWNKGWVTRLTNKRITLGRHKHTHAHSTNFWSRIDFWWR